MKAWVLHDIGDIRYEEIEKPVPKEGEVLVRVMAAGICGSDIPRTFDTGAHRHPLVIGHEFSGIVEAVGSGVDDIWLRKPVGIFPLIPCRKCACCLKMQYEMCESYDYVGSRRDGAFAEYVTVPAWNLIELPQGVSYQAAAMLEPMAVAVHAIRRATNDFSLPKEARIVVCGLGTIGLLTILFLKDAGYENLYGIAKRPAQVERAVKLGVKRENIVEYTMESELVDADLYFECVGRNEAVSLGLKLAAAGGRIMLVGNPASDMTLDRVLYWKVLRKQLTVLGTWNSSFVKKSEDDWHYVLERLAGENVRPETLITHHLMLDELLEGLLLMRDKREDFCKVMIDNTFLSSGQQ